MRKILIIIYSILLPFAIFSFFQDAHLENPNHLGKRIFDSIKNDDKNGLLQLIATREQFYSEIDKADIPDSIKKDLLLKFEADSQDVCKSVGDGFEKIKGEKNKNGIELGEITYNTNMLKNMHLELGEIKIEYKSGKEHKVIDVKIIKLAGSWKILEKFKVRNKNNTLPK